MTADVQLAIEAVTYAHALRDEEVGRLITQACSGDTDKNVEAARALKKTTFYMRGSKTIVARVPAGYEPHGERVIGILQAVAIRVSPDRPQVTVAPFTGKVGGALCW